MGSGFGPSPAVRVGSRPGWGHALVGAGGHARAPGVCKNARARRLNPRPLGPGVLAERCSGVGGRRRSPSSSFFGGATPGGGRLLFFSCCGGIPGKVGVADPG